MSKDDPAWLPEARNFCRAAKITIVGWGPDLLTVEAKSEDRAKQIASELGRLGFSVVADEDESYAGLLSLSLNPNSARAVYAMFDISRRRWNERVLPLIWAFGSLLLVPEVFDSHPTRSGISFLIGLLSSIMFFRDSTRIWGWKLELLPEGIRVRRYYRWSIIPWDQISAIQSAPKSRSEETVLLKLRSSGSESLGSFFSPFAIGLRNRLRIELAQRQGRHE